MTKGSAPVAIARCQPRRARADAGVLDICAEHHPVKPPSEETPVIAITRKMFDALDAMGSNVFSRSMSVTNDGLEGRGQHSGSGDVPPSRQDHMRPRLLRVRVALAAVALAVCVSGAALRIALQIRYRRIRRYRMRCSARRLRNLLRPGSHSPQSRPQRTNRRPGRRPAEPGSGPGAEAQPAGSDGRPERLVKPVGALKVRRYHRIRRRLRSSARRLRRRLRNLLRPGPHSPQSRPQRKTRRPGRRPAEPDN